MLRNLRCVVAGLIDGDFHYLNSECAGGREARAVDGLILIAVECLDGETAVKLRGS